MRGKNNLLDKLNQLTGKHYADCAIYRSYLETFFSGNMSYDSLSELPFLPVRALKEFELKSIPDEDIFKIMTSSGTSGKYSKIFLDRATANLQSSALIEITAEIFGKTRLPILIVDAEATVKNRKLFSARTAAINGFSMFGRKRCFALNDDFSLNMQRVETFSEENLGEKVIIFGFTSFIWQNFLMELGKNGRVLDFEQAILLHGGGWKKLEHLGITNEKFKENVCQLIKCGNVHNYYGMVEQTGSIFMECKYGNMHASRFSEVLTRDQDNFEVLPDGEEGLLQVFSCLPESYPGHSLLTEDVGRVWHGKLCKCGNKGAVIEVVGRVAEAEVRGCSDAYT
jgi:Acyl-protein synthetase, LuxE